MMQGIPFIEILKIRFGCILSENALDLLNWEFVFHFDDLYQRHLIERVDVVDCTAEKSKVFHKSELSLHCSVKQGSWSIDV